VETITLTPRRQTAWQSNLAAALLSLYVGIAVDPLLGSCILLYQCL